MRPNRIGRLVGIGTRVAAGRLRDGTAQAVAAAQQSASPPAPSLSAARSSAAGYAQGGRRLARGASRFGSALWRPVAHATGVLTLQITGVFFALFTAFFTLHAWQAWETAGASDRHPLIYMAFALLFAWFTVTSFWRARTRQKRG